MCGCHTRACVESALKAGVGKTCVCAYLAVVIQIHALGRLVQKRPGWSGPVLGVKESQANKREFTEDQLRAAAAEQTREHTAPSIAQCPHHHHVRDASSAQPTKHA